MAFARFTGELAIPWAHMDGQTKRRSAKVYVTHESTPLRPLQTVLADSVSFSSLITRCLACAACERWVSLFWGWLPFGDLKGNTEILFWGPLNKGTHPYAGDIAHVKVKGRGAFASAASSAKTSRPAQKQK